MRKILIILVVVLLGCIKEDSVHRAAIYVGSLDGTETFYYIHRGDTWKQGETIGIFVAEYNSEMYDFIRGRTITVKATNFDGISFVSIYLDGDLVATDTTDDERHNVKVHYYMP